MSVRNALLSVLGVVIGVLTIPIGGYISFVGLLQYDGFPITIPLAAAICLFGLALVVEGGWVAFYSTRFYRGKTQRS